MQGTTQGGKGGAVSVGPSVAGPAVAGDGNVAVFDGITGKIIRDSGIAIDDLSIKRMFFGGDYSGVTGDYKTGNVASAASECYDFCIPADFSSLVAIGLVGISTGTNPAAPYQLESDYAAVGEHYKTHSESAVGLTIAVVDFVLFFIDASGVFSALTAGDYCGLLLQQMGWGFAARYIGGVLVYSV